MLCTRCAAFEGASITHHTMNASSTHFRMLPSFTAASLEAQTAPSCQFLNTRPKRSLAGGWTTKQVRRWPCPSGSKYARYSRVLRMGVGENVPTCDAVSVMRRTRGSSHAGSPAGGIFVTWRCLR